MLKVKDIMTSELISVPPSVSIMEVAQKMVASGLGVICVCDNHKFLGVITEREIVAIVATTPDAVTKLAKWIMNSRYPTISPDDEVGAAVAAMVDNSAWMLPVVQDRKLLGVFTLDALTRQTARAMHSGAPGLLVVRNGASPEDA